MVKSCRIQSCRWLSLLIAVVVAWTILIGTLTDAHLAPSAHSDSTPASRQSTAAPHSTAAHAAAAAASRSPSQAESEQGILGGHNLLDPSHGVIVETLNSTSSAAASAAKVGASAVAAAAKAAPAAAAGAGAAGAVRVSSVAEVVGFLRNASAAEVNKTRKRIAREDADEESPEWQEYIRAVKRGQNPPRPTKASKAPRIQQMRMGAGFRASSKDKLPYPDYEVIGMLKGMTDTPIIEGRSGLAAGAGADEDSEHNDVKFYDDYNDYFDANNRKKGGGKRKEMGSGAGAQVAHIRSQRSIIDEDQLPVLKRRKRHIEARGRENAWLP